LFAHIALRFGTHPENLATEALNYILSASDVARRAVVEVLSQAAPHLPTVVAFRTQASGDDGAIPDLVGVDAAARQVIIVEAKFWAGLTDHQPVQYIKRLQLEGGAILAFVAPAKRHQSLWPQLISRCHDKGISIGPVKDLTSEYRAAELGTDQFLGLLSWEALLGPIHRALEAERRWSLAGDVAQLRGLCARMDDDAFLPLRSEELTGDTGRLVYQLCELIDTVTDACVACVPRFASVEGRSRFSGKGWYGRLLRLHGAQCFFHFSAHKWGKYRSTPLWLTVPTDARNAIMRLEQEQRYQVVPDDDGLQIAIMAPVGVEKEGVERAAVEQMRGIAGELQNAGSKASLPIEPGAQSG
jgi:hypothetical protein